MTPYKRGFPQTHAYGKKRLSSVSYLDNRAPHGMGQSHIPWANLTSHGTKVF